MTILTVHYDFHFHLYYVTPGCICVSCLKPIWIIIDVFKFIGHAGLPNVAAFGDGDKARFINSKILDLK
jgi:hypothetical protein